MVNNRYDLEARTLAFTFKVNNLLNKLPRSITNLENARQLARSAGSVGANYIEANESLGKKDFLMRLRIARKEAKESRYWLTIISPSPDQLVERGNLIQEATELIKILSAIILKSE